MNIFSIQLASVPAEKSLVPQNLPDVESLKKSEVTEVKVNQSDNNDKLEEVSSVEVKEVEPKTKKPEIEVTQALEPTEHQQVNENLIKISESAVYKKYFLMLKFGVSAAAVKLKMSSEGFESHLLDNPDLLIERPPKEDSEEE